MNGHANTFSLKRAGYSLVLTPLPAPKPYKTKQGKRCKTSL